MITRKMRLFRTGDIPERRSLERGLNLVPMATRFGHRVVLLDCRIDGRDLPFEAVRERIAAYLEAASWSRAVAQYLGMLVGSADIKGLSLDRASSPLVQ